MSIIPKSYWLAYQERSYALDAYFFKNSPQKVRYRVFAKRRYRREMLLKFMSDVRRGKIADPFALIRTQAEEAVKMGRGWPERLIPFTHIFTGLITVGAAAKISGLSQSAVIAYALDKSYGNWPRFSPDHSEASLWRRFCRALWIQL